jgi:small subunit ribosomal protein S16
MATKIRLTRLGKKKQPTYRVVVMDSRKPRDGKYIEQLGIYDPRQQPSLIKIDNERALHWLRTGAQPTERAQKLLEISGAWTQFKVAKGDIHTVADTPAVAEEPVAEAVAVDADDDGSRTTEVGAEAEAEVAVESSDDESADAGDDGAEAEVAEEVGSQKSEASAEEEVEEVTADESSEEA